MQERISTFMILFLQKNRRSRKERRLCSDKKYQQKTYQQFAVAQALVGEDQKDHAEKQKLLDPYIAAKQATKPRKHGRTAFFLLGVPFGAGGNGMLLAFIRLLFLLAMGDLRNTRGLLAARREGRKGVSAVISRKLDGYLFSAVSLLS